MPYLFSYGTLQQKSVQINTFGRLLEGSLDNLVGFIVANLKIQDEEETRQIRREFYPIANTLVHFINAFQGQFTKQKKRTLIGQITMKVINTNAFRRF